MGDLERKAALSLTDEGYSVFPVTKEKVPKCRFSVDVFDKQRILETPAPAWSGIGIHLGRSNVWVLDVDGDTGVQELRKLIDKNGEIPKTRTVKSGRDGGGYHLYWDATGIEVRSGQLAPCLDVKGNSGNALVVAPPSMHKSGNRYSYVSRIAPVRAPEWLRVLVQSQHQTQPVHVYDQTSGGIAGDYGLPSCMVIGAPIDARETCGGFQGTHPFHGSTTGMNFTINTNQNVWKCFRCNSGGGSLELYAVGKGIVACKDIRPGWLKEHYREVIKALEEDGYESKRKAEDAEICAPLMAKIYGGK